MCVSENLIMRVCESVSVSVSEFECVCECDLG